jgi:hypothetical protein
MLSTKIKDYNKLQILHPLLIVVEVAPKTLVPRWNIWWESHLQEFTQLELIKMGSIQSVIDKIEWKMYFNRASKAWMSIKVMLLGDIEAHNWLITVLSTLKQVVLKEVRIQCRLMKSKEEILKQTLWEPGLNTSSWWSETTRMKCSPQNRVWILKWSNNSKTSKFKNKVVKIQLTTVKITSRLPNLTQSMCSQITPSATIKLMRTTKPKLGTKTTLISSWSQKASNIEKMQDQSGCNKKWIPASAKNKPGITIKS